MNGPTIFINILINYRLDVLNEISAFYSRFYLRTKRQSKVAYNIRSLRLSVLLDKSMGYCLYYCQPNGKIERIIQ